MSKFTQYEAMRREVTDILRAQPHMPGGVAAAGGASSNGSILMDLTWLSGKGKPNKGAGKSKRGKPDMSQVQCRKCGKYWHYARDCPEGKGGAKSSGKGDKNGQVICHRCGRALQEGLQV
eukprot:2858067-Amphidinium_carterae.1